MRFLKDVLLAFSLMLVIYSAAQAEELTIGCAANFTSAMKELARMYEAESGVNMRLSFGSTGMLYGQITKGAPYDLFLAADERRPELLHAEGLAMKPSLYASGKVVLWSSRHDLASAETWKEVITSPLTEHVGIANPKTAPYGHRGMQALDAAGLVEEVQAKLSYGKSVGVAFQYAYSGASDASFVALSQALSKRGTAGRYWPVPEAETVRQAACVLKAGNTGLAEDFLLWLALPEARSVIKEYGYE